MKPIPAIKQRDITDCGATCLSAILQAYGSHISVSRLRQLSGTDLRGTSLLGLIQAAETLGLQARAARGTAENLHFVPVHSIMHVNLPSGLNHFMVLVKQYRNKIRVMDPGDGQFHNIPRQEFLQIWSGVFLMMNPSPGYQRINAACPAWRRFVQLARPFKGALIQGFLGAVAFTILGFSTAFYLQKLVDDVIGQNDLQLLQLLGMSMILLLIMQMIIGTIRNIIGFNTGQVLDARLISAYFRHLFYLPQHFFDTMRVGELISRVNDAVKIRAFVNDLAMGLMLNILIVFASTALLCFYYWKLALLVLSVFPVYYLIHFLTTRINRKWQRILMEQSAELETTLVENLQAASTVKRLSIETHVIEKIEFSFFRFMNSAYRCGMYNLYTGTVIDFLNRLLTITVLWAGSWMVMKNEMTTGELLSFYTLIGYFTNPVAFLVSSGKGIQDALIAADRLFEILDLETEINIDKPSVEFQPHLLADIEFEDVCFRYGSNANVLESLNLQFRFREITAIVGESGSGKSTILHLLQQIYPVGKGHIKMGAIPISYFSKDSLRKLVGVIPQQVDLFAGTIAENITIGDPAPDMERVLSCCRQVGADEFIDQLPDTYFNLLGERGVSLSGGQKQKLALARALYRQPEIILLDEVTAHLDPISEKKIQDILLDLKAAGKMVIIIAHRLSTIKAADTIHILKKGRLLASGTHEELMAECNYYTNLWSGNAFVNETIQH